MSERYTEEMVLNEMAVRIGKNDFGYVYPQGTGPNQDKILQQLKEAGGKPEFQEISEVKKLKNGVAKPEFIITFNNDLNTIIVVECKKSIKKHQSTNLNMPSSYSVDGVLFYAKHLKSQFNVIAIAVSGTKIEKSKVSTFYWEKGESDFTKLDKLTDTLIEPLNYLRYLEGKELSKKYSISEIRKIALSMHHGLREIKMSEKNKPIFIAGILIALQDDAFRSDYSKLTSFKSVVSSLKSAMKSTLEDSDIRRNKINDVIASFTNIGNNEKLKSIPLNHKNSITWYIEQLELKIFPMMNYDNTIDALGVFYQEFVRYSGGDGKGLGIVLTPQHLTEFMVELADVNKNSKVLDICCGSGSFLVTAMNKMVADASESEIEDIKKNHLYGVELDFELYTLAIANMIIRKDGKSNLYHNDCFKPSLKKELKSKNINVGLINPPYSQKDYAELEFIEQMLDTLTVNGTGVAVVPMSSAIGTKFKEERERIMKKHSLKAVFSMPDEIFYPTGTNVCVMVWQAHRKHNDNDLTYFAYTKKDGFEKRKKIGRVDVNNTWQDIKEKWLTRYKNKEVIPGFSALEHVNHESEWLAEAYMETDFTLLRREHFIRTTREQLALQIFNGISNLTKENEFEKTHETLNFDDWEYVKLVDIFDFERGTRLVIPDRLPGKIPLVTAGFNNQGISEFISNEENINYKDKITIDMFCNTFYRGYTFKCDDNILVLDNKKVNKYNALFIITVINLDRFKYAYGRQYRQKDLKNHIVKLPFKDGEIDWLFMEDYIKGIDYAKFL